MKTLNRLNRPAAALALALCAAGPAAAIPDAGAPVPPARTATLLQQLNKGGLSTALPAGTPPDAGAAGFEQAAADVGRQQMTDAVKKDEDGMLKSGMYKNINRTADGSGAIITLGDGSVMWSDYTHGYDTMPQKNLQALQDSLIKGGQLNAAQISALKKAVMAQQCQPKMAALSLAAAPTPKAKPKASPQSGDTAPADAPAPAPTAAAPQTAAAPATGNTTETGPAPASGPSDASPSGGLLLASPGGSGFPLGRQMGSAPELFPGGRGGDGQNADSPRGYAAADPQSIARANEEAAAGAKALRVSDDYTFVKLQKAAHSPVVRELEKAAADGAATTAAAGPDAEPNAAPAGSRLFGR